MTEDWDGLFFIIIIIPTFEAGHRQLLDTSKTYMLFLRFISLFGFSVSVHLFIPIRKQNRKEKREQRKKTNIPFNHMSTVTKHPTTVVMQNVNSEKMFFVVFFWRRS